MDYLDLIARYLSPISPVPTGQSPGGRLKAPVKNVLFDVYGTLFISRSGDIHMARQCTETGAQLGMLLKTYNYPGSAKELIDAVFRKISDTHEKLRQQGTDYPEVQIDRIWRDVIGAPDIETARRFAIEFEMIVNPCYSMPHVAEVFSAFKQNGIRMGIISNAQFFTPLLFQVLLGAPPEGLGFSQNLIFYSYRLGVAKPSGLLFQLAAAELGRLGFKPGTAVYVGNDMRNDILPALSEGFQTALFAGDQRSLRLRPEDPGCAAVRPDLVITDWHQIIGQVLDLKTQ